MKVGLIGAGLMGSGLARLFAKAGWAVSVFDPDAAALDRLGAQVPETFRSQMLAEAVGEVDLVVESAPEKPALKQAIFADLAAVTRPATILGTNSSVIPVGVVTEKLSDADAKRAIGLHFWNPPDIIPLVEVIRGPRSGDEALKTALGWMREIGKDAVPVEKDAVPGNRMQAALWREAIALVEEGVCTPEDVDLIVKRSFALRLAAVGPLENLDLIGLDLGADIQRVVLPTLSRATEPSKELTDRIARGETGGKSGNGFYRGWTQEKLDALRVRLVAHVTSLLGRTD